MRPRQRSRNAAVGVAVVAAALAAPWFPAAAAQDAVTAPTLRLNAGQVESLHATGLERVAVGDPAVADVIVLSEDEVLVKGERAGTTTLLLWDAQGKRAWDVVVTGQQAAVLDQTVASIRRLLDAEGLASLALRTEGEQIYLSGRLASDQEQERLTKLLDTFPSVINLTQQAVTTEQEIPLIALEVQVIEVTRDAQETLGLDWADKTTLTETITSPTAASTEEKILERVTNYFKIGAVGRSAFSATLNHLLSKGQARILAAPNLVTLSGKPATSFLGGEIPVITTTSVSAGTVTQQIEFKPIGTKLTITPTISADHTKISSQFESELRTVDNTFAITVSGINVPGFKVRKTKTEVLSRPGETIVIAGLLQTEESTKDAGVPKLSHIPFLGRALFTSRDYKTSHTELLVVVTPSLPTPYAAGPTTMRATSGESPPAPPHRAVAMQQLMETMQAQEAPPVNAIAAAADPLTTYAQQVQQRLADGLASLDSAEEAPAGAVRLGLRVAADGTVREAVVVQSSGNAALDQSVLNTAQRQGPYPVFPAGLAQPELWLEVPVIFNHDT